MSGKSSATLVYSTETGRIFPDCSQPAAQCQCAANKRALAAASGAVATDGVVRVHRATQGAGRQERDADAGPGAG
jgi:translation initiation factor 1